MSSRYPIFNRHAIKFKSVEERESLINIEEATDKALRSHVGCGAMHSDITDLALDIKRVRDNGKPVILCMGAHAIKNGGGIIINKLIEAGLITHVATNGAAAIHDWEFAKFGKSTECVRTNVARGEFGLWEETGAIFGSSANMASECGMGWGERLGWLMSADKSHYKAKEYSVIHKCYEHDIPFTIHPGIGQDIIYSHPNLWNISCTITDFEIFAESVRNLEHGIYLSVGSSVMSPMIFEKALSMARNVEHQNHRIIDHFLIAVNDLADSNWNWEDGEPPMDNPAYYLRFMKTFHRMGGQTGNPYYYGCHNVTFLNTLRKILT